MNLIFFKDTLSIAKRYFLASEKKASALAYFFSIMIIITLMVFFNYALSLSLSAFWASLATLNFHVFFMSLIVTSAYIFTLTCFSLLRNFLTEVLINNWREFLTLDLINKYLEPEKQAYLFFSRHQAIDNVGQNIQWDVHKFTSTTLNLSFDFFGAVLSILTFSYSLWQVGGNLSFTLFGIHLFIPGYLIIASLLLGLTANFISYQIGKRISPLINDRLIKEAELRNEIEKVHDNAEFIAQAKSSEYHQTKLSSIFSSAQAFSFSTLYEKMKLNGFQFFFSSFAKIFPYLIASPLYFTKKLSLDALNQAAYAFTELSRSMAWFNNAYEDIALLNATSVRLNALYFHLDNLPHQEIEIHKQAQNDIDFALDEVFTPNHELLFKNLKLKFKPHENVLIKGPSGLGKSTIFKSLAENWPYGKGQIFIPQDTTMMFLPQKPFIPCDDFRAVISYPDLPEAYSDETYITTLKEVGLESFIPRLYQKNEWASSLSGGQQQRVLFARAILKKPTWLFMDESSASLDQSSEEELYTALKRLLVETTIISIAHRDTVAKFHDTIIHLFIHEASKEVMMTKTPETLLSA